MVTASFSQPSSRPLAVARPYVAGSVSHGEKQP